MEVSPSLPSQYLSTPGSYKPVVTDPEDPRFDLEKLVASWEAQS